MTAAVGTGKIRRVAGEAQLYIGEIQIYGFPYGLELDVRTDDEGKYFNVVVRERPKPDWADVPWVNKEKTE